MKNQKSYILYSGLSTVLVIWKLQKKTDQKFSMNRTDLSQFYSLQKPK